MKRWTILAVFLLCISGVAQTTGGAASVLPPADLQTLVPPSVYFDGQTATVQVRNSAGVRWSENKQTLFAMVDTSGYSSALRDRYQFYILTDAPVEFAGHTLQPGAYGGGFLESTGLLVMDLAGTELFHVPFANDPEMKRPRPLQVVAGPAGGEYRLYLGRNYVSFRGR